MLRGTLAFPMIVELAQLDTIATAADPDGAGPLTSGYDEDFQEPIERINDSGDVVNTRAEAISLIPAQIKTDKEAELNQLASGNSPNTTLIVTFHFDELEELGLLDPITNKALIKTSDRLASVRKRCDQDTLVQSFPEGLYCTSVRTSGWMGNRNLLICVFSNRDQGIQTA